MAHTGRRESSCASGCNGGTSKSREPGSVLRNVTGISLQRQSLSVESLRTGNAKLVQSRTENGWRSGLNTEHHRPIPVRRPHVAGLLAISTSNPEAPHFRAAFVVMIVTNGALLLLFALAAVQLLRLKKSGVTAHTSASVLLVAYNLLIGVLWTRGGRIGMSVAAATGVGNLGIAPFQGFNSAPYMYPIISSALLIVTYRKVASTLQTSRGIAH